MQFGRRELRFVKDDLSPLFPFLSFEWSARRKSILKLDRYRSFLKNASFESNESLSSSIMLYRNSHQFARRYSDVKNQKIWSSRTIFAQLPFSFCRNNMTYWKPRRQISRIHDEHRIDTTFWSASKLLSNCSEELSLAMQVLTLCRISTTRTTTRTTTTTSEQLKFHTVNSFRLRWTGHSTN